MRNDNDNNENLLSMDDDLLAEWFYLLILYNLYILLYFEK